MRSKLEITADVANGQINASGGGANMDKSFVYTIQQYTEKGKLESTCKEDEHDKEKVIRMKDWYHGEELRAFKRKDPEKVHQTLG